MTAEIRHLASWLLAELGDDQRRQARGDRIAVTPHSIGAEPALIPHGPRAGRRLLGPEQDLARRLVSPLDPEQRPVAVVADEARDEILTRHDPVADPTLVPAPYVRACGREATEAAPDAVRVAWAGPTTPGAGVDHAVTAPTWLIEYDNTQDDVNYAHSVWRHLRDDFGRDLRREHHAPHHEH